jgi:hypothetical protein
MEIITNNRATRTSTSIVQPIVIIKPISPLRGGTCLEIPLLVQTFTIHIEVTIEHVVDNGKFVKDENEHVDPPFTITKWWNRTFGVFICYFTFNPTPNSYRSLNYFDY